MSLETELQTYESTREQLLREQGKYVLIQGRRVLGVYVAYEDALKAGYEKAGKGDFLVKKIEATETVHLINRALPTCHT